MGIKLTIKAFIISVLLMISTTALAWKGDGEIKVMTQNQFLGADLVPLLAAPNTDAFNTALISVLTKIADNRFRDRVQRQAAQIAKEQPHIVALQEVWAFECQDFTHLPGLGCDDPSIKGAFVDHLQETLLALKAKGQKYRAVASVKNLDVSVIQVPKFPAGIPFLINGVPAVLNTIDRDVILARADIPARPVDFTTSCQKISLNGCNYQAVIDAPTPVGSLPILRGFVAADAKVHGKVYRIVNTHLEVREPDPTNPLSKSVQAAQAMELIQTLQMTTPPDRSLLLLGDMNSSPEDQPVTGSLELPSPFDKGITPPYRQFVDAGYTDGWTLRHHVTPGYTCCQAENLLNKQSELYERIDYIFSKQDTWGEDIHLVGARHSDKTLPPAARLWPSDHAGLVGALHFWE